MKKFTMAATLLAAGSQLTACGAVGQAGQDASPTPKTATVKKMIRVPIDQGDLMFGSGGDAAEADGDYLAGVTPCLAKDNVIASGDQVVIRDGARSTIAIGNLTDGVLGAGAGANDESDFWALDSPCVFTVEIADVPLRHKFYEVQVGTAQPITMTQDELTDAGSAVDIG